MKKIRWDLIGIYGSAIAVLIGVFAVIKAGGPGSIFIALGMIVVFGSMGYFFYKLLWGPRIHERRLHQSGIPGRAKIVEVRETNITINNNPQVKLMLEVTNSSGHVYHTSCKVIVPRLKPGLYKTGMELPIKIDPGNEKKLIIDLN